MFLGWDPEGRVLGILRAIQEIWARSRALRPGEGRRVRAGMEAGPCSSPRVPPGPLTWVSVGTGAASESWATLLSFASSSTLRATSLHKRYLSRTAALRGRRQVYLWVDPAFLQEVWEEGC